MSMGNMEISTVVGCKMQCSYCPQKSHMENYSKKSSQFSMTLEDFRWFISTIPIDVDIVMAGMAEPFLNKDCMEMIKHAYLKGHRISVYTTGYGITMDDIKELGKIEFNHFCLHFPDADGLMNIRITPEYLEVLKALLPIKKNEMCIGKLHPAVREAIGFDVNDGSKSLYSRGGNLKDMMIPRKEGKLHCSSCTDALNHNVLMPNGDVLLCCMDYDQKHVIGNLNNMPYSSIFESEEYKRVKQGLAGDESIDILCRTCEISKPTN